MKKSDFRNDVRITNAQLEMLKLISEKVPPKEIARRVNVTERAVRQFLASLRDGTFRAKYERFLEKIFEIEKHGYLIEGEKLTTLAWETKLRKLRNGYRPAGRPPFGYKFEDGKMMINPEEAEIVRFIFKQRIKGKSMFELGKEKGLHRNVVRHILKNPFYKGEIRYSGQVFKGKHEAIIDPETWDKAQAVRLAYRGSLPFGYRRGEGGRLVIEPDEAEIVRHIYKLRLNGRSYGEIAQKVDMSASGVRSILKAPVYAGLIKIRGEITLGDYEKIISLETWRKTQKVHRLPPNHVRAIREKMQERGLETRKRILDCLSEGPLGFLELSRTVGVTPSNIAVQLKRLKANGLVDKAPGKYGKWYLKIGQEAK